MTREEAEEYAKEMTYRDAINNLMKARSIPYRKATFIKINELLKALEQEPKTGHWIFQKIIHGKRMWCSNCDSSFDLCCNQIKRYDEATKKEYLWSHCPWCGAKMVEPQEISYVVEQELNEYTGNIEIIEKKY